MGQRLLNVRVRPQFLSKLWGGRYNQILVVDSRACDDLTRFRLASSRPEFVYGIGLDDGHWAQTVRQVCQPRGYGPLRPEVARDIKQAHAEDYFTVDHALVHLFRTRDQRKIHKRVLRLVRR